MADKNIKKEQGKRRIDAILYELFQGRDSAIEKYSRVRHTQWELALWRVYGLPLKEVAGEAKQYFSKRFLNGERIAKASDATIADALERLNHAVKDGCHGRCMKLVVELNQALNDLGLEMVSNPEQFLDWLTFDYTTTPDDWGRPAVEKPFGFELRYYHDAENRKEFWAELQRFLKNGKIVSMQDVLRIVLYRQSKKSVSF